MTIGEKISLLLEENGMKGSVLAERIGVSQVSISRYRNGTRIPRRAMLTKIAKELGTTAEYLKGTEIQDDQYVFFRTLRDVTRFSCVWDTKQKLMLINAMWKEGEDESV